MIDRRSFIKLLMAAPAIKVIDVISPNKEGPPKALLVDPYQVNMKDLEDTTWDQPLKIIRVRRPYWGQGPPIQKIV
jgi:hypothetical protein